MKLEMIGISKSYGSKSVLKDISVNLLRESMVYLGQMVQVRQP